MQRPKTLVPLDEEGATKLMKLIDTLEDLDDTDEVHANFDIDAEILERVAGLDAARRPAGSSAPRSSSARSTRSRSRASTPPT